MRKLSIFLLALVAILGLSGCFNNLPTGGQTQPSDDQGKTEVEDQLDTSKTYHLVGGNFGWGDAVQHGVNVLAPTTVAELKANEAYASVATTLEGKELTGLYILEGATFKTHDTDTWTAQAFGETYNAGFTLKILDVEWVLDEDDEWVSGFGESSWNPGRTSHVEMLNDQVFTPAYRETVEEGGDAGLGCWNDNAVCIGGAGVYTVIYATYKGGISDATNCASGLALVKTSKIQDLTLGEKIEKEYNELKEGKVTTPSTWELAANVLEISTNKNETSGEYDVDLIVEINGVKVAVSNALKDSKAITNIAALEKGTAITISGAIEKDAAAVEINSVSASVVLTGANINWSQLYIVSFKAPEDATAVNVYFWGSATACEWPGFAAKNENGVYTCELPLDATGLIFNWDGKQTVDLTPNSTTPCWTVGELVDGKYAATAEAVYHTEFTVVGLEDATSANAYWWGSAHSVDWPGVTMTKNEDGTWTALVPTDLSGECLIFNWDGVQTVNLTVDFSKPVWTIGEVQENGQYAASCAE